MRIYFDTCSLQNLALSRYMNRDKVNEDIRRRKFRVYLSAEVIGEICAMANFQNGRDKIGSILQFIMPIVYQRAFDDPWEIIKSELIGENRIFLPAGLNKTLFGKLNNVRPGIPLDIMLTRLSENTCRDRDDFIDAMIRMRKGIHSQGRRRSFEQFHRAYWDKHGVLFWKNRIDEWNISLPGQVLSGIINSQGKYSYAKMLMAMISAHLYFLLAEKRNIRREPGINDYRHLLYATGTDLFVTDDSRLTRTGNQILSLIDGTRIKIMTTREFLAKYMGVGDVPVLMTLTDRRVDSACPKVTKAGTSRRGSKCQGAPPLFRGNNCGIAEMIESAHSEVGAGDMGPPRRPTRARERSTPVALAKTRGRSPSACSAPSKSSHQLLLLGPEFRRAFVAQ